MPEKEKFQQAQDHQRSKLQQKTALIGTSFAQRREEIFKRLKKSTEECKLNYNERKELATEKDDTITELLEAIEDSFSYGLRQHNANPVMSAVSIFQNMQEIVTGNVGIASANSGNSDTTFWDFCQMHLTAHEKERYENLKHVWTKHGRGKAFIRASLNENSLQRYLLTWLSEQEILHRFYTPWSLLLDAEAAKQIPQMIGGLNKVLFALNADTVELNVASRAQPAQPAKEEPIIYAPTPVPVAATKHKRKTNIVERPIATHNSTDDLLKSLQEVEATDKQQLYKFLNGSVETAACIEKSADEIEREEALRTPPDPIEPELAFLKEPLREYVAEGCSSADEQAPLEREYYEDKSDTSSQYSKSSSANCSSNVQVLEEKVREMSERCALLETRVAQLSLENRQLVRRLTQYFNESGIDPSSSLAANFLITIPHVKLLKTRSGSSYYSYEIHITMRQHLEHWVLLRRYRDFYKLHKSLLHTHPSIGAIEFPPKKHFGNMNLVFVEERRQQLQIYLLNVVESLPQVEVCKSKAELQKVFPFLREQR